MLKRAEIKTWINQEPRFDDIMCSLRATGRQPAGIIREVKEVVAIARKFNAEVTRPACLDLDRRMHEDSDYLPWEYVKIANEWGFYSLFIPKLFGGRGYAMPSVGYFIEEIASQCLAMANIIGVHYLGVITLSASWNVRVINHICREVVAGEKSGRPCLLSLAMTEPDAGTDSQNVEFMNVGNLGCHAQKVDGGYRVTGNKIFISMGHLSTWHMLHAYTDLKKGAENTVMLAVKTGSPGFSFGKKEKKMGQKGSIASELIFQDCFVPDDLVCIDNRQIAELSRNVRDTNEQILAYIWAASRMGVGAFGTGTARGALEEALCFASAHEIEGEPLINQEWCQSRLAEMYKNVAISRTAYAEANYVNGLHGLWKLLNVKPLYYLIRYTPLALLDKIFPRLNNQPWMTRLFRRLCFDWQADEEIDRIDGWGSLAKFACTDAAMANCQLALEIMGQAGLRHDGRVEKMLRDAKLLQIYEGTNQVNRLNLFKRMLSRSCPCARPLCVTNR